MSLLEKYQAIYKMEWYTTPDGLGRHVVFKIPGTSGSNLSGEATASGSNISSSQNTSTTTNPVFIPPFPYMPFLLPPPPPIPAADLSSLSLEELQALEGQERENIEARIRCLRNIQTLLDGAAMQMQQYSSIIASLRTLNPSPTNQATANSSNPSKSENVPTMNGDNLTEANNKVYLPSCSKDEYPDGKLLQNAFPVEECAGDISNTTHQYLIDIGIESQRVIDLSHWDMSKKHITRENAYEFLITANELNACAVKKKVIDFMVKQKMPTTCKKWPDFVRQYYRLAHEVYCVGVKAGNIYISPKYLK